jgi:hypothetical protein
MWKDAEGKIVTKKPALSSDAQASRPLSSSHSGDAFQSLQDFACFTTHEQNLPISPPTSNNPSLPHSLEDHDSGVDSNYHSASLDPKAFSTQDSYSPIDQRFWSADITQPQPDPLTSAVFDDASFDEVFNPDTASSFNAPFTTMNNYNWLFDMDWSKNHQAQQMNIQDPFPVSFGNATALSQPNNIFDLDLNHVRVEQESTNTACFGSITSQLSDSLQHHSPSAQMITPPLGEPPKKPIDAPFQPQQRVEHTEELSLAGSTANTINATTVERPMSMLHPSRSLPVIDELARQQLLDLIDIIQPTIPDGSIVMRDHPLLSLSCLQTYCDLFFTRFNTTYPLIHMVTFDPSEVDTLLLVSMLLLGATYGEKDAHQLAVSSSAPLISSCN